MLHLLISLALAQEAPERLELDEQVVKGQSARSGVLTLQQRSARPLPPLVPLRQSFRDEIVAPVFPEGVPQPTEEVP